MANEAVKRNEDELAVIRAIAQSGEDRSVLMLNLNRYSPAAEYPNGTLYRKYMAGLEAFLPSVGGRLLWRHPVFGQAVGEQAIDEVLGAWYPSHRAFLALRTAAGADDNYRLRDAAVAYAVIHRCPGDDYPFCPN